MCVALLLATVPTVAPWCVPCGTSGTLHLEGCGGCFFLHRSVAMADDLLVRSVVAGRLRALQAPRPVPLQRLLMSADPIVGADVDTPPVGSSAAAAPAAPGSAAPATAPVATDTTQGLAVRGATAQLVWPCASLVRGQRARNTIPRYEAMAAADAATRRAVGDHAVFEQALAAIAEGRSLGAIAAVCGWCTAPAAAAAGTEQSDSERSEASAAPREGSAARGAQRAATATTSPGRKGAKAAPGGKKAGKKQQPRAAAAGAGAKDAGSIMHGALKSWRDAGGEGADDKADAKRALQEAQAAMDRQAFVERASRREALDALGLERAATLKRLAAEEASMRPPE